MDQSRPTALIAAIWATEGAFPQGAGVLQLGWGGFLARTYRPAAKQKLLGISKTWQP